MTSAWTLLLRLLWTPLRARCRIGLAVTFLYSIRDSDLPEEGKCCVLRCWYLLVPANCSRVVNSLHCTKYHVQSLWALIAKSILHPFLSEHKHVDLSFLGPTGSFFQPWFVRLFVCSFVCLLVCLFICFQ